MTLQHENEKIRADRLSLCDVGYAAFQSKLMPGIPKEQIIGVRTPLLRAYAKRLAGTREADAFLASLPHLYYDENNLHAALLEHIKDFDVALSAVE
ncbi:MAG: DNA alkylation repair protein, partial [Clostridia bacterium]|nr:DNA alkylation repair protein [Clostridia bacterium]